MGLQVKLVLALLAIGLVPVTVSAVLIDRISEVAQSFASNEVARMRPSLERAQHAYVAVVTRTKELHAQVGRRIAVDRSAVRDPSIARIGLIDASLFESESATEPLWKESTGRTPRDGERVVTVRELTPAGLLVSSFVVDDSLAADYLSLGETLAEAGRVRVVRESLPRSYRTAFIAVVGGFAVVLIALGVVLGRGVTRRIEELVAGFRAVADGDLSVRVSGKGRDELAEMGRAFNRMVADLEGERRKSAYLQRIGTWQDVARKLAHEIKNPLTPIQLAVQQVHSAYNGDDAKFARTLDDADEIVREEIGNLRRLVDAFRELGRLPKVEAKPIDLQVVIDDLLKDPDIAAKLEVHPPPRPILVRADRLLIRRVLHNLVDNAIDAGGEVSIGWRETDDGRAEVIVDDSGPGIPEKLRESLFEPYVTSKETGTGLGLAIAKKIAIEHGGSLELDPAPSPLGGARFVVAIPMAGEIV